MKLDSQVCRFGSISSSHPTKMTNEEFVKPTSNRISKRVSPPPSEIGYVQKKIKLPKDINVDDDGDDGTCTSTTTLHSFLDEEAIESDCEDRENDSGEFEDVDTKSESEETKTDDEETRTIGEGESCESAEDSEELLETDEDYDEEEFGCGAFTAKI